MKKNRTKSLKNKSGKKGQVKHQPQLPKNKKSTPNWLRIAIIIVLGIIIYSNSFDCSFHMDDSISIVNNNAIKDVTDINSIWNHSKSRFIPYLSLALNYHFGGLNVWGYHLINLMIHLITSCLVYWFTILILSAPTLKDKVKIKDHRTFAFITALLFVSHPLATQSVTYIVQRMASMVALFYLLSLCLYLKGRLSNGADRTKKLYLIGSIIIALFALFTKQNAFTLPFSIILLEICFLQSKKLNFKLNDYRILSVLALSIIFFLMVFWRMSLSIFDPIPPAFGNTFTITPFNYLLTQFSVILNYIQLLILPVGLNLDHDVSIANSLFELRTFASLLTILAIIGFGIYVFKRNKILSFGIFFFFITLSVESSFIPLADLMFEHRTYLPSFGFFLILSFVVYKYLWLKNKSLAIGLLVLIIGSNSYMTYQRNKDWKNDFTLWSDVISKSPNKARPHGTRGDFYRDTGKLNEAFTDYSNAIKINPKYTTALQNRGYIYKQFGQLDQAVTDYSNAIDIDPNYAIALCNRGMAYVSLNQLDNALKDYTKAIEANKKFTAAYYARSLLYGQMNQREKAIADCNKAISIDPLYSDAYFNRGFNYYKLGQPNSAIPDYSKAIELNPNNSRIFYNRGLVYSNMNQWDKAIADYDKALALDPNFNSAREQRKFVIQNRDQ